MNTVMNVVYTALFAGFLAMCITGVKIIARSRKHRTIPLHRGN